MMASAQHRRFIARRKERPPVKPVSRLQLEEVLELFAVLPGWPWQAVAAISRDGRHELRFRLQGPHRNSTSTEAPNQGEASIVLGDDEGPFWLPCLIRLMCHMSGRAWRRGRHFLPDQGQQAIPPQNADSQVLMNGEADLSGQPGDFLS